MKRGKVQIDRERCKACGLCMRACPVKILAPDTEMNRSGVHPSSCIAIEKCIACGSCYQMCPDACIEVFELEGDEK